MQNFKKDLTAKDFANEILGKAFCCPIRCSTLYFILTLTTLKSSLSILINGVLIYKIG